ncbi:MAG: hypothetical protein ACYTGX_17870 [Planctomycetota bacterium]|jgi:hypothetical protein
MPELASNDVLSAHDNEQVRKHMVAFIRRNFGDMLGRDVDLLQLPQGLDMIRERVLLKLAGSRARLMQALERLRFDD